MAQSFRKVENWSDYTLGCPEGTWRAELDHLAWGRSKNLILYLSEIPSDEKYWLSVFWRNGYRAEDGALGLRELKPGAVLELTTTKTKSGNPRLLAAVKISDTWTDQN